MILPRVRCAVTAWTSSVTARVSCSSMTPTRYGRYILRSINAAIEQKKYLQQKAYLLPFYSATELNFLPSSTIELDLCPLSNFPSHVTELPGIFNQWRNEIDAIM